MFLFPVLQVSWNFSNPPRVLDLDDRQGLIASSALQQKKQKKTMVEAAHLLTFKRFNPKFHLATLRDPALSPPSLQFQMLIPEFFFFWALCCLGKIPGGAPFSQLHKSGNGSRVDRP